MEELRVSDLMSSDPQQWVIALLHELFNDRDVKAILQIPLQETNCPDSWVCHYSKTGKYTVKSGYWVGLETSSLSEENGVAGEWGKIWNLQVLPKVKHFLWRATRKCLPVRASLQRKGIQVPLTCIQCGGDIENTWHIFLTCPVAQSCWSETQFVSSINSCSSQVESFVEFIFMMLNSLTTKEMGKVVMILWSLWRQRNEKLWNNQQNTPTHVVHFALQNLYDWLQAKEQKKVLHPNSNSVDTSYKRWHKPPASFLKCNTDAALFTSSNRFGLSGVLRDENGEFIACRLQHNAGNPVVKECEALALLHAIT
ncbi:uncharacterized protein [Primulina huaijiensis]|uniref:uncharacterized protein n=1 Tax=Primulina huaijiensis TaxID=1492673 RepID=UPI003CC70BCF